MLKCLSLKQKYNDQDQNNACAHICLGLQNLLPLCCDTYTVCCLLTFSLLNCLQITPPLPQVASTKSAMTPMSLARWHFPVNLSSWLHSALLTTPPPGTPPFSCLRLHTSVSSLSLSGFSSFVSLTCSSFSKGHCIWKLFRAWPQAFFPSLIPSSFPTWLQKSSPLPSSHTCLILLETTSLPWPHFPSQPSLWCDSYDFLWSRGVSQGRPFTHDFLLTRAMLLKLCVIKKTSCFLIF